MTTPPNHLEITSAVMEECKDLPLANKMRIAKLLGKLVEGAFKDGAEHVASVNRFSHVTPEEVQASAIKLGIIDKNGKLTESFK